MNIPGRSISSVALLALVFSCAAAAAQDLASLADRVARTGSTAGLSRYAIEDFSAAGGAAPEEALAAKTEFAQQLNDRSSSDAMDAGLLAGLARGKDWPQAFVQGTLYGSGTSRSLVIRVRNRSGRALGVYQLDMPAGQSPPPDLRDAPGGISACERRRRGLALQNRDLVELKARYWAAKVRSPDFSYSDLPGPPGGELKEYPVIQRFYSLVNAYYDQQGPVIVTPMEKAKIEALIKEEAAYAAECAKPERR